MSKVTDTVKEIFRQGVEKLRKDIKLFDIWEQGRNSLELIIKDNMILSRDLTSREVYDEGQQRGVIRRKPDIHALMSMMFHLEIHAYNGS